MRYCYRLIILLWILLFSVHAYATSLFLEGIYWRPTETNNWGYVNSLTVPNQTLTYKTIDFTYSPGFRIGTTYSNCYGDALLSYTYFNSTTHDSETGTMQAGFSGSVTAKGDDTAYLFSGGQVSQTINYNIIDANIGRPFYPTCFLMLHPTVGLMGGWIDQTIHAQYNGAIATNETIKNNFKGIGPKVGIDVDINLINYQSFQPKLFASFATSYLLSYWNISDYTTVIPANTIYVEGASRNNAGAFTLQSAVGLKVDYHQFSLKLAYEMGDWFDQCQFFDNDTGVHNNDLVLQGLTLGLSYHFA